jgi:hypothetical protein
MSERKSNSKTLTKLALTRRRNGARRLAARRKTPLGRLHTEDLPKVLCNPTDELLDFAENYDVSLDSLLCGDLTGLHRMIGKPVASKVERIMEKYDQFSPDQQRIVTEEVDRMLAEQAVEGPEGA